VKPETVIAAFGENAAIVARDDISCVARADQAAAGAMIGSILSSFLPICEGRTQ
jgi:hypothetical protein